MLKLASLLLLAAALPPTSSLECWKCADQQVIAWRSHVKEINIGNSKWNTCDKPELIQCTFGCYEARLTVFEYGDSYARSCATDKVMRQMKWNGTNILPERHDNKARVQGRMCTVNRCNRFYADRPWAVEFITINATAIAITGLLIVCCIPVLIFTACCAYKKYKNHKRNGYHAPSEDTIISSTV